MQLLNLLAGISPWWWVAFGVALGALEMATMSFFLIWPALAALMIAALVLIAPSTGGEAQIAIFAILAVILTFAGRSLMHRFGNGDVAHTLNSRANLMVGRHATVLEFSGPEGVVLIDNIRWHAIWPKDASAAVDSTVQIADAKGMTLYIGALAS